MIRLVARVCRKRCTLRQRRPAALAVADVRQLAELLQAAGDRGLGVGVAAEVVAGDGEEQVARRRRVRVAQQRPHVVVHPLLLGADDRDDLGVDEDRVRRALDLRLLKAQLRDDRVRAGVVLVRLRDRRSAAGSRSPTAAARLLVGRCARAASGSASPARRRSRPPPWRRRAGRRGA